MAMNMDDFIGVTFEVPGWITEGLNTGSLFREGGVVRRNTGEIAMFLRESSGLSRELAVGNLSPSPLLSSQLSSLQSLSMASIGMQALNLGISAVGFAVVAIKLNRIESKLNQLHRETGEILSKLNKNSERQDLEMIAKMKAALEIADNGIHASSGNSREYRLNEAMNRLIDLAASSKLFLDALVSAKEYSSESTLFDLYYRIWVCCRVAITQCKLLLDEGDSVLRDIENTIQENDVIYTDYLCNMPVPLQLFAAITYPHENGKSRTDYLRAFAESPLAKPFPFIKTGELILDTGHQLKGYQLEIDYVRRNGITYREWMNLGKSEEPGLSFLLPKKR